MALQYGCPLRFHPYYHFKTNREQQPMSHLLRRQQQVGLKRWKNDTANPQKPKLNRTEIKDKNTEKWERKLHNLGPKKRFVILKKKWQRLDARGVYGRMFSRTEICLKHMNCRKENDQGCWWNNYCHNILHSPCIRIALLYLSSTLEPHRTCFLLHLSNTWSRCTNYSYWDSSAWLLKFILYIVNYRMNEHVI